MSKRILDETNNIIHVYTRHIGIQEVPIDLHQWACIAGIAACVADRVWLEKFKGKKLTPALYTCLIAPSGRGKGMACDTITDFIGDLPIVNAFAGATTAERLMEMMSNTKQKKLARPLKPDEVDDRPDRGKIFIVQEELALCISSGPAAQGFIKFMTGLYKRDAKLPWRKETVAGAQASIDKGVINWLFGSTKEWLIDAIPPEAIEGGFAGRIACVFVPKKLAEKRVFRPTVPEDYDEVREHLRERFVRLTQLQGAFTRTGKALQLEEHWYMSRPNPHDERLMPTWQRQHDLLLKLSMVLSLAESEDLRIRGRHMAAAQKMVAKSYKAAQQLLIAASASPETRKNDTVREMLKRAGSLQITTLSRMASSRGLTNFELMGALTTLKAGREVETVRVGSRQVIVWRKQGRRRAV